jgi:hypothetical protein
LHALRWDGAAGGKIICCSQGKHTHCRSLFLVNQGQAMGNFVEGAVAAAGYNSIGTHFTGFLNTVQTVTLFTKIVHCLADSRLSRLLTVDNQRCCGHAHFLNWTFLQGR